MGIKFNCPNGHKLNVKSFLAGKKGVCPHCGAKFRIPATPAEEDHEDGPAMDVTAQPVPASQTGPQIAPSPAAGNAGHNQAAQAVPAPTALPVGALPVGQPVVPPGAGVQPQPTMGGAPAVAVRPISPAIGAAQGAVPAAVPVGQVVTPVAGVTPAAPVQQVASVAGFDPIAENPNAVWYVRPPSGGQYGPARGDIMRKWIAEGRVTGTSLVWRDGWPDWRSAGEALPDLRRPASASAAAPAIPLVTPATSRSANRYVAGRKKSNAMAIAALVLLTILCLVMVAVLVVVLGGVQLGQPAGDGQTSVPVHIRSTKHTAH